MSYEVAVSEMHILAYCYHWDRDTLWDKGLGEDDDSVSTYTES